MLLLSINLGSEKVLLYLHLYPLFHDLKRQVFCILAINNPKMNLKFFFIYNSIQRNKILRTEGNKTSTNLYSEDDKTLWKEIKEDLNKLFMAWKT